jgi:hypothetical protein
LKKPNGKKGVGGMVQVVERLPSKFKRTAKQNKNKNMKLQRSFENNAKLGISKDFFFSLSFLFW